MTQLAATWGLGGGSLRRELDAAEQAFEVANTKRQEQLQERLARFRARDSVVFGGGRSAVSQDVKWKSLQRRASRLESSRESNPNVAVTKTNPLIRQFLGSYWTKDLPAKNEYSEAIAKLASADNRLRRENQAKEAIRQKHEAYVKRVPPAAKRWLLAGLGTGLAATTLIVPPVGLGLLGSMAAGLGGGFVAGKIGDKVIADSARAMASRQDRILTKIGLQKNERNGADLLMHMRGDQKGLARFKKRWGQVNVGVKTAAGLAAAGFSADMMGMFDSGFWADHVSPAGPELGSYTVQAGDNTWSILRDQMLEGRMGLGDLDGIAGDADLENVVGNMLERIKADPTAYGFDAGFSPDRISVGDSFDFDKIKAAIYDEISIRGTSYENLVDRAANLTEAEAANIARIEQGIATKSLDIYGNPIAPPAPAASPTGQFASTIPNSDGLSGPYTPDQFDSITGEQIAGAGSATIAGAATGQTLDMPAETPETMAEITNPVTEAAPNSDGLSAPFTPDQFNESGNLIETSAGAAETVALSSMTNNMTSAVNAALADAGLTVVNTAEINGQAVLTLADGTNIEILENRAQATNALGQVIATETQRPTGGGFLGLFSERLSTTAERLASQLGQPETVAV